VFYYVFSWRIVIHGAIDGFTRLIFFLKVATNNRAATVFKGFREGVDQYGLPSRVRQVVTSNLENRIVNLMLIIFLELIKGERMLWLAISC
jgi:hypothetical protein